VRSTLRRLISDGSSTRDPTIEPDVSTALKDIGQNPDRVLPLAASDEMKAALQSQLEEARTLELFGSPTFVTDKEIFWGDDRLEDAIRWHRQPEQQTAPGS
jgi:2-hydroxychromene-2-carboxylate isomerase